MAETENHETEDVAPDAEATPEAPHASASDAAPASEAESASPANEPGAPPVPPKERRRRARAQKAAATTARQPMTPEERHAERVGERQRKSQARRVERTRSREKARAARAGAEPQTTPPREHGPGRQKTRQGVVVSDKADKTITVRVDIARRHRRYEKIVRTSNTLHAHDETNDAHIGDTVIVRESRPISRLKRWRLIQVVERAE
jgi:small subunit ribosomal protein S17